MCYYRFQPEPRQQLSCRNWSFSAAEKKVKFAEPPPASGAKFLD